MPDADNLYRTGTAHGKAILIGEHIAVYGYPAIVMPVQSVRVTASVEPATGPLMLDSVLYRGPLADAPDTLRGLSLAITEYLAQLGRPPQSLLIRIASELPAGRGLGSSAAVTAAVIRAIATFYQVALVHDRLMSTIQISETVTHGTPSGIDAEAVVSTSPLWFIKGRPVEPLPVHSSPLLLVADSGQPSNTRAAVESVRLRWQSDRAGVSARFERLAKLVQQAKEALLTGSLVEIAETLNEAQQELASLGVSHRALEQLIQAAHRYGALGSKLTGSGRGGCIVTAGTRP